VADEVNIRYDFKVIGKSDWRFLKKNCMVVGQRWQWIRIEYIRWTISLDFTVARLLMKLLRTSNKDVINECCSYFNYKLPSEILPARFERFVFNL